MNTEPEIDADMIVTTMGESEIAELVMNVDALIGDINFTQFLLKILIESLRLDVSKDEVKTILMNLLNDE
jgi:hypothetical protein